MKETASFLDAGMRPPFRLGNVLVEPSLNRFRWDGRSVHVEPKVMEVLVFLSSEPGTVFPKDKILRAVWPDTFVTDKVLTYCISELRKALGDDTRNPKVIQTIPRRGYRVIAVVSDSTAGIQQEADPSPAAGPQPASRRRWLRWAVPAAAVFLVALGLYIIPWRKAASLADTDNVLLGSFTNSTGDPSFDEILKQALAMHLEQSPYLNVFPEERVRTALQYMDRAPDEQLTKQVAREVCLRQGIKAMISGSIAGMGRNYVISLEAVNAQSGDVIAREQVEAAAKEQVLTLVGRAATSLRKQLGESLASIQRFDVPLEQATTPSLEAFHAYSMGRKYFVRGQMIEAMPHYLRALEHDPGFASAYDDLAWCYSRAARLDLAAEAARKAFALRDRVSEYERYSIEAVYYYFATGQVDRGIETLELMRSVYPRSAPVHNTLGVYYARLGRHEKAIEAFLEAIRLNHHPNAYPNLARSYLALNRFDEAQETLDRAARIERIDNPLLHEVLFLTAYHRRDRKRMDEQLAWAAGKPAECFLLKHEASAASGAGQLRKAAKLDRQAEEIARRYNMPGAEADFAASTMVRNAMWGTCAIPANPFEGIALEACDWISQGKVAFACALCGRTEDALAITSRLTAQMPQHTLLNEVWFPLIEAATEIGRGNSERALELLRRAGAHEIAGGYWPSYLRAQAHLKVRNGKAAAAELESVLRNPGLSSLAPYYPLAQLTLGRAYNLMGDPARARDAYRNFLAFWKGADADNPILEQARSEYARVELPKIAWLFRLSSMLF